MNNYPLIKKWLGLICHEYPEGYYVKADALETKLAEGFEVYQSGDGSISKYEYKVDKFVSLAIGKQPIKKQTQAEAALELLKEMVKEEWGTDSADGFTVRAKEVLEMKE